MLFSAYKLNDLVLPNRVVMAPMTRSRAVGDGIPSSSAATYYAQRATAGLIVTEATQISHQGIGYIKTPGIHSAEQVAAWSTVTNAVHAAGGRIVLQLWHVGRCSHFSFHEGEPPVAPSAIAAEGMSMTAEGPAACSVPRALETAELAGIVADFVDAAKNAMLAGFDGVELHGANGYLLDQFTRDSANRRGDAYGGNIANRIRLPVEVAEAVAGVWGADRVGYRVSPAFTGYSMADSTPVETFAALAAALRGKIGYLHVVEPAVGSQSFDPSWVRVAPHLRKAFDRNMILCGGYDRVRAEAALGAGEADLIGFAMPFIANPDLVARVQAGVPLAKPDPTTIYGGDDEGYVSYPAMA